MNKIEAGAISKAELARNLGVTRSRVTALCKRGLPVRPDGKIILADAFGWMRANCEQTAQFQDRGVHRAVNASADPEPPEASEAAAPETAESTALDDDDAVLPYAEAKALRETFLARMAKLEFLAKSGKLLDATEVESTWRAFLTDCRRQLLCVPSRCASRMPHLSRSEIAIVDSEIRDCLLGLSGAKE
jgi:phage terminase Nu1 subunit (DNA packaging protein)